MSFKLFPSNHERTIFIVILSFCIGLTIGLLPSLDTKTIAGAVATVVAAFAGAFFAYKFNADSEKQKKDEIDLASANKTLFTIIRIYNYIASLNQQLFKPYEKNPASYVLIPPLVGNSNPNWKFDFDSISFLISEKQSEILTELAELEELFSVLTETLTTRNHIHLNEVQPAMESAGITNGESLSLDDIDKIIGDRSSEMMKGLTTELIEILNNGEEQSDLLVKKLHEVTKSRFPNKNVIKMKRINKPRSSKNTRNNTDS